MPDPIARRSTPATGPQPRVGLQERVSAAIVAAAANVFATGGTSASMGDVAAAAGVGRATLYRYFPTRQALIGRLAEVAVRDAGQRLAEARLDGVSVREAVVRVVRALLEVGDYFAVLARERVQPDTTQYDQSVREPVRRLMERGQASGALRRDIRADSLATALLGLTVSMLPSLRSGGRDNTVAAVSSLFLDGATPTSERTRAGPAHERK